MKKLLPAFLILWSATAYGQAFITRWQTNQPGISNSNQITIPTTGDGYSYSIYWESASNPSINGNVPGPITGNYTITFPTAGDYRVHITGSFPRIFFNEQGNLELSNPIPLTSDSRKIYRVEQWGSIEWTSMAHAFQGCRYLNFTAADTPDLSRVTDMSNMFNGAISFNSPIGSWDVSHVTNMSGMFHVASNFNQPLGNWDVSKVTDMSWMFGSQWEDILNLFNQPIGNWDVSKVTNMSYMFCLASHFNQPIGNWNVSNVTDMSGMFSGAARFNQPIGNWDVSNVTNMSWMFGTQGVGWLNPFNQPIGNWDVSKVTNMSYMFYDSHFNQPIGNWDVSNVTDMSSMFSWTESFNQSIGNWDVSNVTHMSGMFYLAKNFNQPIGNWDVSNVTNMATMFGGADSFNQPIGNWSVGKVTDMSGMFHAAHKFNQPIGSWDVSNVNNMSRMFSGALNFNQPLGNWIVSKVADMSSMFAASAFNQPVEDWDVSNVTDMSNMFSGAINFNQPLGNWILSNVTDMNQMFFGAANFNQPIGNWDVSNVTNMSWMFYFAENFNQAIGSWDVGKVSGMEYLLSFSGLDIANYDQTLIGWAAQNVQPNVALGADGLKYCAGETARTQLITGKGWIITGDSKENILPAPVISVLQPLCKDSTGTITVDIQYDGMLYSFDGGLTFQSENIKTGLIPGNYSVIISNGSGCSSNPEPVVVNSPPVPTVPSLSGSPIVCPNIIEVDYRASILEYTYNWFIEGGVLKSRQNNTIKVDWGPTNFNASVKAIGYNEHGCPTDTATFPVKIQIQLKPEIISGMDSVCYNFRTGVPYQSSYTNGSVYTWFSDGGQVAEGQSTSQVKIDWAALGQYKLWVKEENTTSTDYCEGLSDTLHVTVFQDLAAITMNFVSVDYTDDKKVRIQWEATLLERISDLIIISRRIAGTNDPWQVVATLQKNVQSFLDLNVQTSLHIYEYKVEGFNKCDEGLQTVVHNTIRLEGDKVEEHELIDLHWNDYNGWHGVERYEIWRKLDGDSLYRLLEVTPGEITDYAGKHGADGFVHLLKVKAKKKDENTISWSNTLELEFENPIDMIPNIITPNGDSMNEYFVIPRLYLYPDNALNIYNRWGETVYKKINYSNDWNGSGLPNGVYYYSLYLLRSNKTHNGWVQVMR